MIILSWNVKLGRATARAIEVADELGADVVLLQEASPGPSWPGPACREKVEGRGWGSSVLVRSGGLEPLPIPNYRGWVTGASWHSSSAGVSRTVYLFSLHSPTGTKDAPRGGYVAESRRIVRAICATVPLGAPLIIGGDFNFKSLGERLPTEQLANDRGELQALKEFRALGQFVAWRDSHPDLPLPQTLRWTRDPAVPFHCDGFLFRGMDVRTVQCEVLSSGHVASRSDHNPVVLRAQVLDG